MDMSFAHGPITVVQTPSGRYKGKKITKKKELERERERRGVVWFGFFLFFFLSVDFGVSSDVA
jgi:hypothetical protein